MSENTTPDLKMINASVNLDGTHLLSYIERIERLNEQVEVIQSDIKEIYAEAKISGFDKKYIKELIKLRKLDPDELDEQDKLLAMYRKAAGI